MADIIEFYKDSEKAKELIRQGKRISQKMEIKEMNGMDTIKDLAELVECALKIDKERIEHPPNLEWAIYAELCKTHDIDDPVFDPYVEAFQKKIEDQLIAEGYEGPFDWENGYLPEKKADANDAPTL